MSNPDAGISCPPRDRVPRYLWRVIFLSSAYTNESSRFGSGYIENEFVELDVSEARQTPLMALRKYVKGEPSSKTDKLISTSSSLLRVLHSALQQAYGNFGSANTRLISIGLVDTTTIEFESVESINVFVQRLKPSQQADAYRSLVYGDTEFLVHAADVFLKVQSGADSFQIAESVVTLSDLVSNGLLDLIPEMDASSDLGFPDSLAQLRRAWYLHNDPVPICNMTLFHAGRMATCFRKCLWGPALITLLTVHRRPSWDRTIIALIVVNTPKLTASMPWCGHFWRHLSGDDELYSQTFIPNSMMEVYQLQRYLTLADARALPGLQMSQAQNIAQARQELGQFSEALKEVERLVIATATPGIQHDLEDLDLEDSDAEDGDPGEGPSLPTPDATPRRGFKAEISGLELNWHQGN